MTLVDRSLEIRWCDPVVVEMDAHSIVKIDADLDRVVGIDAFPEQTFLLADGCQ